MGSFFLSNDFFSAPQIPKKPYKMPLFGKERKGIHEKEGKKTIWTIDIKDQETRNALIFSWHPPGKSFCSVSLPNFIKINPTGTY